MKNLYDPGTANELKSRIAQLRPDCQRQWGSMTPAQVMTHCSRSLEWALGEKIPPRERLRMRIMGRLIKPLVLNDDKPLRRNTPTLPDLIVHDEPNLESERARLCSLIDRFATAGPAGCTQHPHAFFGPMKPEEWAILMYKHLDHHLRQFSV